MTPETKILHEERLKHIADARALIETAEKDEGGRNLNDDEQVKYDNFFAKADALKKRIDQFEALAEAEKNDVNKQDPIDPVDPSTSTEITQKDMDEAVIKKFDNGYDSLDKNEKNAIAKYQKEEAVFWKNLQLGYGSLNDEEKKIYADAIHSRQQSVGTNTAGGYLVPKQFQLELEKALLPFGGMREAARIITSEQGGTLDWPTVNDTANQGRWLGENEEVQQTDVIYGQKQFSDYIRSSDNVLVSFKLMNDNAFNLPNHLRDLLAERIGRGINVAYTTGNGSSKPRGVTLDTALGITAAASNAITANELIDLYHSVNSAYRKSPKALFMFTDLTMKAIRKLKDTDGQYLWQPGLKLGEPDVLFGKRIIINDDLAEIGVDNKSILFGDFNKYLIRDIQGFILLRLNERFADKLQVGFNAFLRTDGKMIDAGTNPIKHLRHPNT